eukprot:TRINITY_DN2246_c0_g1_i1.p1 TRINITY_DN2246_c0_g1~~TRINITY_DN2246_c0_g1_i1.p1  ORF type:complete len:222 (-),score=44.55 TRINITY_DN2246_c0_g1_i1:40-705(-)
MSTNNEDEQQIIRTHLKEVTTQINIARLRWSYLESCGDTPEVQLERTLVAQRLIDLEATRNFLNDRLETGALMSTSTVPHASSSISPASQIKSSVTSSSITSSSFSVVHEERRSDCEVKQPTIEHPMQLDAVKQAIMLNEVAFLEQLRVILVGPAMTSEKVELLLALRRQWIADEAAFGPDTAQMLLQFSLQLGSVLTDEQKQIILSACAQSSPTAGGSGK